MKSARLIYAVLLLLFLWQQFVGIVAQDQDASGCGVFCNKPYPQQPWFNLTLPTHNNRNLQASIQCKKDDKVCERAEAVLLRMFDYNFTLPQRNLDRSVIQGDLSRMYRVAKKLVLGQPITITLLGGSVSTGAGQKGGRLGKEAFYMQLLGWMNHTFAASGKHPQQAHTLINKSRGGKTALYFGYCVQHFVDETTDLVIVDITMNDWYALQGGALTAAQQRVASEQLLRSLLSMPQQPAVIILNLLARKLASTGDFTAGLDESMQNLGMVYGVPTLSYRNMVWQSMLNSETGFDMCEMWCDVVHPTVLGHKYIADMIVAFFQDVTLDAVLSDELVIPGSHEFMARRSVHTNETQQVRRLVAKNDADTLPPALHGSSQEGSSKCTVDNNLRTVATRNEGWQWSDEGRGKWGWLTEECGQTLELQLSTDCALPVEHVVLGLGHLKSYEGVGDGRLECVEGCTCHPQDLSGWWDTHVSIDKVAYTGATQAAACKVRITSGRNEHSGSCKFKLVAVYVACLDNNISGML